MKYLLPLLAFACTSAKDVQDGGIPPIDSDTLLDTDDTSQDTGAADSAADTGTTSDVPYDNCAYQRPDTTAWGATQAEQQLGLLDHSLMCQDVTFAIETIVVDDESFGVLEGTVAGGGPNGEPLLESWPTGTVLGLTEGAASLWDGITGTNLELVVVEGEMSEGVSFVHADASHSSTPERAAETFVEVLSDNDLVVYIWVYNTMLLPGTPAFEEELYWTQTHDITGFAWAISDFIAHEFGHGLGVNHNATVGSLMFDNPDKGELLIKKNITNEAIGWLYGLQPPSGIPK